jgi:hypothetical protein
MTVVVLGVEHLACSPWSEAFVLAQPTLAQELAEGWQWVGVLVVPPIVVLGIVVVVVPCVVHLKYEHI